MGLLITPVLIIVSLTGAIYVFKPQLEPMLYPELFLVEPSEGPVAGLEDFRARTAEALPDHHLEFINFYGDPQRSWEGFARRHLEDGSHENLRVFFNQYTGEWLGWQDYNSVFFRVVLDIHRRLMVGLPGRLVVETVTCWGILAILTGLYLWWKQKPGRIWGFWLPRFRGSLRTVLRDWHTVPGAWLSLILIAILFTGLLFTKIWGTAWLAGNAFTGGFPEFYTQPPESTIPDGKENPQPISLDAAYATALNQYDFRGKDHGIEIPHHGPGDSFQIITDITKPWQGLGVVFVDAYDGSVLLHQTGEDMPLRTHLTLLFYPIHVGSIGGLPTQILAVLACLGLVFFSVSGVLLWWNRRPNGKFGAPKKRKTAIPPQKTVVSATLGFAILFPTVGITLLAILACTGLKSLWTK